MHELERRLGREISLLLESMRSFDPQAQQGTQRGERAPARKPKLLALLAKPFRALSGLLKP